MNHTTMKSTMRAVFLLLTGFGALMVLLWLLVLEEELLEVTIGRSLSPWWGMPFGAMLLVIALVPLMAADWWQSNLNKGMVAAGCGAPVLLYFLFAVPGGPQALVNLVHEYYSFLILLAALYTISGGIRLDGDLRATPATNTSFLALGGLMASFVGTTGAAMLLIRPVLRTNQERRHTRHIFVFFIFIVANLGGLLTPLGDPPLFLGFLRGVPFSWTFSLWKEWLLSLALLLAVFYAWDSLAFRKETIADRIRDAHRLEPLSIRGGVNFIFLLGIIVCLVVFKGHLQWFREPIMVLLAIASYLIDRRHDEKRYARRIIGPSPRTANRFTFHPMIEVGVLFAGIFVTMLPAICLLKAHGGELGVTEPWQFFWLAGGLSSFLDNAPTYVTYFSLAQGLSMDKNLCGMAGHLGACVAGTGIPMKILAALSCGAVMMGANTYIGNAPNFMVKSIVEEARVKMPSFIGYMGYSIGILIPLFLLLTLIFFRS